MKTIWYCHHYAGSPILGMSYRPYYLTREFAKAGHQAHIISASFHHLLQEKEEQSQQLQFKTVDDVSFITLKTRVYQGNGVGRLLNMMDYVYRLKRNMTDLMALTGKPDVIIVSSAHPFHYLTLEKLARKINARLIFEVRDLWPLSLQDILKTSKRHPLLLWLSYIERKAYRRADYVVSLLDNAFSYMSAKGLSFDRYRVIPNGTCVQEHQQDFPLDEHMSRVIRNLKDSGQFLLGYTGALGKPNAMHYLISAMAILMQQTHSIHCIIVGDGQLKDSLCAEAKRLGLENVTFFSSIPKKSIPAFLKQMDALYLGWNPVSTYQYGVSPNKLFDYMMAGKPVIQSGGAPTSIVEQKACGLQCKAADPNGIAEAIYKMSLMTKDERGAMGANGALAVRNSYDYDILAKQYMKLF